LNNVLGAARVSETEIDEVASSPQLYAGIRSRINARRTRQHPVRRPRFAFEGNSQLKWVLAVGAVLVLIAAASLMLLPRTSPEPKTIIEAEAQKNLPVQQAAVREVIKTQPPSQKRTAQAKRVLRNRPTPEVATDFFPLTYSGDSSVVESGHVVRVRMPRSALIAFGVPMNVYRTGELVNADLFIGDDGLARAIRFIQ